MRPTRSLFFLLTAVVLATACSGSSDPTNVPDGPTIADLVGQWNATSLVITNSADESETFDWIAAGGENRFTMLDGGRTRSWLDLGDFHDEWDATVTMNSTAMTLTFKPVESARPVQHCSFMLSGNTLTLTETDLTFDFTQSGADGVAATVVTVFTKTAS